ncbi:hypothetical protein BWQ96_03556 [Gracilariopsis chorda]|uniref:Uncharacterized protein n=1 Tax=Gracilariopsis chorda TaxID=448386 RepID=A0A2V3IC14_9FLOR|nr:hypothetical protein BWQ96_10656 [Gracilariopsis chorda]PXF46730.1 hypothetical protein BWQ96_03556 [Gracilariopsis chorda]|eukprot:PXF39646.1 hypothetical protein BWQ96_10656 [Gracilariopsis chorda]
MKSTIFAILFSALVAIVAASCPRYRTIILTDAAHKAAGINGTVLRYKELLGGDDNGNAPGPLEKGQRSINWDAGIVPFNMPGDFFNTRVTRGAVLMAKGGKFAVSNPAMPPPEDDRFSSLLPKSISNQFRRFSLERLFTPVLSNRFAIKFQIPAKTDAAKVSGFGAVFTDVDKVRRTTMVYLDKNGCRIAKINVPPKGRGLSFAGLVVVDKYNPKKTIPVISKVLVKLGNTPVSRFSELRRFHGYRPRRRTDVVVMDDFFYGEPMY